MLVLAVRTDGRWKLAATYCDDFVKNPPGYSFGVQKIPEASNCKYLGIILRSDLNWADQVNYTAQKAWKEAKNGYREYSFVIRTIKTGTNCLQKR